MEGNGENGRAAPAVAPSADEENSCRGNSPKALPSAMYYVLAGIIGLISGITSGLFGVGGGVVMVPAMVFFMQLDMKTAVGTSLAVIIPTALVGTLKHYQIGNINWAAACSLAPMALLGGYLGARLTVPIASADLKRGFGAFLVLVGLRLLFMK